MKNDLNEWLTIREAAREQTVDDKTIRRTIENGEVPAIGKESTRLIHRVSINEVTRRKVGQKRLHH